MPVFFSKKTIFPVLKYPSHANFSYFFRFFSKNAQKIPSLRPFGQRKRRATQPLPDAVKNSYIIIYIIYSEIFIIRTSSSYESKDFSEPHCQRESKDIDSFSFR